MIYAQRREDNRETLGSLGSAVSTEIPQGVCLASTNSARVSRLALGDLWGEVGGKEGESKLSLGNPKSKMSVPSLPLVLFAQSPKL